MDWPKKDPTIIPLQTDDSKVSPLWVGSQLPLPPESDVAKRIREQTDIYRQRYHGQFQEQTQEDRLAKQLEHEQKTNEHMRKILERMHEELAKAKTENKTLRSWIRAVIDRVATMGIYVDVLDEVRAFFVEEALTGKGDSTFGGIPFREQFKEQMK